MAREANRVDSVGMPQGKDSGSVEPQVFKQPGAPQFELRQQGNFQSGDNPIN
jgi:hypothetical protein